MSGKQHTGESLYSTRVVIGAPGSGKSSLFEQYLDEARAERRQIFVFDPQDAFPYLSDRERVRPNELDPDQLEAFLGGLKGQFRGLLLLDDADLYVPKLSKLQGAWRDLFVGFRHWQVDVVLSTRRPQNLNVIATDNADTCALFRCGGMNTKAWVEKWLGRDVVKDIPREPFRYQLVPVHYPEERKLYQTKKRTTVVAADQKV